MEEMMLRLIPIVLLLLSLLPTHLFAKSTMECHCFQNRTYNPQATFAADPYFLATAQNSFMALVYGQDKKQLVKAKMSGQNAAQLWIRYDLAGRSRRTSQEIAQMYSKANDWRIVVGDLGLDPEALGPKYLSSLQRPEKLAAVIVDHQLEQRLKVKARIVQRARAAGMTNQELILSALLASDPLRLFRQVKAGQKSWGEILFAAGLLDGEAIKRRIEQLLR